MGFEGNLWTWFRTSIKPVENLDIQRIETRATKGVPDVEGCLLGRAFWIELKACDRPANTETKLEFKIKREQKIWLERRWRCGGIATMLIRVGYAHEAKAYLIRGCDVGALHLGRCPEGVLRRHSIIDPDLDPIRILHAVINCR